MLRFVFPLVIGLGGAAVLSGLGVWQLQRLAWKEGILAEIEAKIAAPPVALPEVPRPEAHRYLPVAVAGETGAEELHVLVSQKVQGAGFRVITALETEGGRRLLLDQGFVPVASKGAARAPQVGTFQGNLHWPEDRDSFTPENDLEANYWFARDLAQMAEVLGTEPLLLVLARSDPPLSTVQPLPVTTEGIPNSHLGYALQWFGLATVWITMTGLFLWRRRAGPTRKA